MTLIKHTETRNGIAFCVTWEKGHAAYRYKIEGKYSRNFYTTVKAAIRAARRHIDSKIVL